MEDGLRACKVGTLQVVPNVLILVVVEDGLRAPSMNLFTNNQILVLILVVVEDGLRVLTDMFLSSIEQGSLNPCCCGRWSQSNGICWTNT